MSAQTDREKLIEILDKWYTGWHYHYHEEQANSILSAGFVSVDSIKACKWEGKVYQGDNTSGYLGPVRCVNGRVEGPFGDRPDDPKHRCPECLGRGFTVDGKAIKPKEGK